jgi:hypothetical protein
VRQHPQVTIYYSSNVGHAPKIERPFIDARHKLHQTGRQEPAPNIRALKLYPESIFEVCRCDLQLVIIYGKFSNERDYLDKNKEKIERVFCSLIRAWRFCFCHYAPLRSRKK